MLFLRLVLLSFGFEKELSAVATVTGMVRYSNSAVETLLNEAAIGPWSIITILARSLTVDWFAISYLKQVLNAVSWCGKLSLSKCLL